MGLAANQVSNEDTMAELLAAVLPAGLDELAERRASRARAHRPGWPHRPQPAEPAEPAGARTVRDLQAAAELRLLAERQRIAGALHDEVGQLLFAAASTARRAQQSTDSDAPELRDAIAAMEQQVQAASAQLRILLHSLGPAEQAEAVPTAAQRDLDDLTRRSEIETLLLVRGEPRRLSPVVEKASLNCLRQALFNIERHSDARTVVVTVDFQPDRLALVVQDDGRGLPEGFQPRVVAVGATGWGFASMARQVEQLGGTLSMANADEGGTRLLVHLPAE
jgi:signal transduction histidine kinase